MKLLSLAVVAGCVFAYFVSELLGKLNARARIIWRIATSLLVLGSIVLGFAVLGSPRTQRLYRYDEQKVSDLQSIDNTIQSYYSGRRKLPESINEAVNGGYFYGSITDPETQEPYEYNKTGETAYELCAEFNKETKDNGNPRIKITPFMPSIPYGTNWKHPAGRYCFERTVSPEIFKTPYPL